MIPKKPVQAANVPTSQPRQQIPHEQIARRAEEIWRERNRPVGQDKSIWLEAESQLQGEAEARPVSGTPSRPYRDEPATPVRDHTKVQDPTESAVQTRSVTGAKSGAKSKELRTQ